MTYPTWSKRASPALCNELGYPPRGVEPETIAEAVARFEDFRLHDVLEIHGLEHFATCGLQSFADRLRALAAKSSAIRVITRSMWAPLSDEREEELRGRKHPARSLCPAGAAHPSPQVVPRLLAH